MTCTRNYPSSSVWSLLEMGLWVGKGKGKEWLWVGLHNSYFHSRYTARMKRMYKLPNMISLMVYHLLLMVFYYLIFHFFPYG